MSLFILSLGRCNRSWEDRGRRRCRSGPTRRRRTSFPPPSPRPRSSFVSRRRRAPSTAPPKWPKTPLASLGRAYPKSLTSHHFSTAAAIHVQRRNSHRCLVRVLLSGSTLCHSQGTCFTSTRKHTARGLKVVLCWRPVANVNPEHTFGCIPQRKLALYRPVVLIWNRGTWTVGRLIKGWQYPAMRPGAAAAPRGSHSGDPAPQSARCRHRAWRRRSSSRKLQSSCWSLVRCRRAVHNSRYFSRL